MKKGEKKRNTTGRRLPVGAACGLLVVQALVLPWPGYAHEGETPVNYLLPHAHGSCLGWQPLLLWLHIVSDSLTAIAYYSIPVALLVFARRRRDLQFRWMFVLFGIFIMACGTTHVMSLWTLWKPAYLATGIVKAITAASSIITAVILWLLIPKALALPGPAQWEAVNRNLRNEVSERQEAEAEVRRLNAELERKVEERTRHAALLQKINSELKTLYEVSQAISRTLDMDKLLSEVLHSLARTEIFPFELKGAIFLVENGAVRLGSFISLSETSVEPCKEILPGKCLCGLAVATGEIVVSRNSAEDRRHTVCNAETDPHGHIVVPLKAVDKVVGLLTLYTHPGTEVDENLQKLLYSIGSQIGIAINNATLYEETKNVSLHDPLTGLANRRFLQIQLEKSLESAKRYGEGLSVIMLDIDYFKRYNDTHGHLEGDKLLVKLADIISREMRKADYVFRYGGEEFLVILPETDLTMAREAAERLRAKVESEAGVTISLGVVSLDGSVQKMEELVAYADTALYRAKKRGRNRVETFLWKMKKRANIL